MSKGGIHIDKTWPREQESLHRLEGQRNARCANTGGIKKSKVRDSNISMFDDFKYMKVHIFALQWRDEIKRSSQLRTYTTETISCK